MKSWPENGSPRSLLPRRRWARCEDLLLQGKRKEIWYNTERRVPGLSTLFYTDRKGGGKKGTCGPPRIYPSFSSEHCPYAGSKLAVGRAAGFVLHPPQQKKGGRRRGLSFFISLKGSGTAVRERIRLLQATSLPLVARARKGKTAGRSGWILLLAHPYDEREEKLNGKM